MLSTEIERFQYKLNTRTGEVEKLKQSNLDLQAELNELSQVRNENLKII